MFISAFWSYYCELISINDERKRSFYEKGDTNDKNYI